MRSGPWLRSQRSDGTFIYGDKEPEVFKGTVVVSIGRSVSGKAILSPDAWVCFRDEVRTVARSLSYPTNLVFKGSGEGVYEGKYEESYTVVIASATFDDIARATLAALAKKYEQYSIAVTLGRTEFVGGNS